MGNSRGGNSTFNVKTRAVLRARAEANTITRLHSVAELALDVRADVAEGRVGVGAKRGDGCDANHDDERQHNRVLNSGGAIFVLEERNQILADIPPWETPLVVLTQIEKTGSWTLLGVFICCPCDDTIYLDHANRWSKRFNLFFPLFSQFHLGLESCPFRTFHSGRKIGPGA